MPPLRTRLSEQLDSLRRFAATRRGKTMARALRTIFVLGILTLLAVQVSQIGWDRLWDGLPRTPWFYVLVLAVYFVLPFTEAMVYGSLWRVPRRRLVGVSLRKRVLNVDVIGYSGDVYFCLWARKRLGLSDRLIWQTYKDNTVLSAIASVFSAVLLLAVLWFSGQVAFAELLEGQDPLYVGIGAALLVGLAAVAVLFRRTIFSLAARVIAVLFAIHVARFGLVYVLQVLQWWVVLPEAPFSVWGTMLAVMVVANRLPLLPARDLLSIGAILGMTGLLDAAAGVIAGMLLVRAAIDRLLNAGFFAGTLMWERRQPIDGAPPVEPVAEPAGQRTMT